MKTLAAILVEQKRPLELAEVEVPALGFGQVLVDVLTSRICGSQLGEIDGVKGPDRWLPHLLGHEGGGIVREVGPEVTTVKPGDHVVLHWRPGAGIQSRAPVYGWNSRKVSAGYVTTFNHCAVVSENRLTTIPTDFDLEIAALLADTLTTGFGIINRDAAVRIGESVVVFGIGGIGLGVVLAAQLAGAHPIVAVDLHAHKLDLAHRFGATHTLLATSATIEDEIRATAGGAGADVVIDGTGRPEVIERCCRLTQPKGRTVLFGVMRHDQRVSLHTLPLHHGKVLTGSEGGGSQPTEDIPRFVRMMRAGRFDPKPMISHRGALADVNDLIARMRAGEVVHAMLHMRQTQQPKLTTESTEDTESRTSAAPHPVSVPSVSSVVQI
jgi:S-(hydroxymethyl)glutathione dehydrogenase / alcohol dehydrogenase